MAVLNLSIFGEIAQLVEQWTENPRVRSSILRLATTLDSGWLLTLALHPIPGQPIYLITLIKSC